jgi:glutamyl-tRNA reductase
MLMQTTSLTERCYPSASVLVDEAIVTVRRHAVAICEQQLRTDRGRLSNEQAELIRTVVDAIVDRLLSVPETRMNAAVASRDYANLLVHLFVP